MLSKLRFVFLLFIVAFLVSCGGGEGQSNKGPGGDAAKIHRGGVLKVALSTNPLNFDQIVQNDAAGVLVTSQIVEGLYKFDKDLKPVPYLAESVDISADGLAYTFHLRKGVKFHDGTMMDADAVKFSMDRVRNNSKAVGYNDGRQITETIALSTYDFQLTLSEPFAPLPSRLTSRLGGVVSPQAVKSMGDQAFNQNPIGTGPFKFTEFRSDNYVRLTKFDGYWQRGADGEPLPYLDGVEFRIITEASGRFTALQAGDVHLAGLREADIPDAKKDSNIVMEEAPGFGWSAILLTIKKPPFDNKALRQAVAFAIDRDEINRTIYEGNRTIANSPIPPLFQWASDPTYKPYTYDPGKAKKLLAEAGQPEGFEFECLIQAGDATMEQMAVLIQAQLAKVGIKMRIPDALDLNGALIPKMMRGESNAYQIGLTGGPDLDDHVAKAFMKGSSFNVFPYENARVEDLIRQGRRTTDLQERARVYREATKVIMDDSPAILIVYSIDRYVGKKSVKGWFTGFKATTGYSEYWLAE